MSQSNIGRLIIVVGPSGAGKDSVIKAAQSHFEDHSRIGFVRRTITRKCDPAAEVHDSVDEQQFEQMDQRGEFSVSWRANGLFYGLPASIHDDVRNGCVLIANGSRAALDDIRSRFNQLTVVHITASEAVLAQRLKRRSRESTAEIQARLKRNSRIAPMSGDDVVAIDNGGERHVAIAEFIALLESCLKG